MRFEAGSARVTRLDGLTDRDCGAPQLAGASEIELVVASTVLLSVLLHGVTAAPLSAAYARRVEGMPADAPEKSEAVEMPTRVGPALATEPRKGDESE